MCRVNREVKRHRRKQHDEYFERFIISRARQICFNRTEPVDVFFAIHKVANPEHYQERAAKCVDGWRCFV